MDRRARNGQTLLWHKASVNEMEDVGFTNCRGVWRAKALLFGGQKFTWSGNSQWLLLQEIPKLTIQDRHDRADRFTPLVDYMLSS